MNYDEFAADLPADRTIEFTTVEKMEETFREWGVEQPMRQLGNGSFRSALAVQSTKQADLFSDRYSTAISVYLEPPPGNVGFLFPRSASGQFVTNGEDVGNDKLVALSDGSGADIVVPALAGSETIIVPEARFIEMAGVLCPMAVLPEVTSIFEGDCAQLHALRKAVADLVAQPESDVQDKDVANVIAQTIGWMGDSRCQSRPKYLSVNQARVRVARLAQEYIEAHYSEAVHVEDLCRVTGVGVRTLQRCFREYFNLTVSDYLKTVRLDSARRELVAAHPTETSVTRIAMRNGCTHLGRFSVEFRERFGQSPKETLAMQAGNR
ncbi:MAG: helix-turn-helix transcriptional regulator [Gammaproteobacteria bacterium]|nr:helix-turn-helix transcriptional regulator [Gammaproteobacteria bacterium]MDH3804529.1 helix-turn-helix transcriptional regulator [Gammaproteobacteria bacterium]